MRLVQIIPASAASPDAVERILDQERDWYRYRSGCYLVIGSSTAKQLVDRLRPLIDDDESLLVLRINPSERQGWMSKDFWDWFRKYA